jgi:hypothetical protein
LGLGFGGMVAVVKARRGGGARGGEGGNGGVTDGAWGAGEQVWLVI